MKSNFLFRYLIYLKGQNEYSSKINSFISIINYIFLILAQLGYFKITNDIQY